MESLVGKRFEYKGLKIGRITVITEPRTGFLFKKNGEPKDTKTCLVSCSCGNRYELSIMYITNNYIPQCSNCGERPRAACSRHHLNGVDCSAQCGIMCYRKISNKNERGCLVVNKIRLVQGVGINDANYSITRSECTGVTLANGKKQTREIWKCPFYRKWDNMLTRSYCPKYKESNPTYKDCTVCNEWLLFSDFRKWMIGQDWEGNHLDKDILFEGNKIYSPDTCIFVTGKVNGFIKDCGGSRGKYLIGSHLPKNRSRFISYCKNPFKDEGDLRKPHIGTYYTEIEAHLAWKERKHEYACQLANSEYVTDEEVRKKLLTRYANFTVVEGHLK